jgi:hypothetical protein
MNEASGIGGDPGRHKAGQGNPPFYPWLVPRLSLPALEPWPEPHFDPPPSSSSISSFDASQAVWVAAVGGVKEDKLALLAPTLRLAVVEASERSQQREMEIQREKFFEHLGLALERAARLARLLGFFWG